MRWIRIGETFTGYYKFLKYLKHLYKKKGYGIYDIYKWDQQKEEYHTDIMLSGTHFDYRMREYIGELLDHLAYDEAYQGNDLLPLEVAESKLNAYMESFGFDGTVEQAREYEHDHPIDVPSGSIDRYEWWEKCLSKH